METESLLREITDATTRISDLVLAAKQYSQMDRAPYRFIDVHEGLDATLVMFGRKLGDESGIGIVKDYDRTLPPIPAYPAELNQVWTNIIDNAIDAMDGAGHADRPHRAATATACSSRSATPARASRRTSGSGSSSRSSPRSRSGAAPASGLDVSYRVVVNRHHGDSAVDVRAGRHPLPGPPADHGGCPVREGGPGSPVMMLAGARRVIVPSGTSRRLRRGCGSRVRDRHGRAPC